MTRWEGKGMVLARALGCPGDRRGDEGAVAEPAGAECELWGCELWGRRLWGDNDDSG